ncbi:Glyoxalase-like domain protein [Actinomadura rubteroloni]|uniref:Glyoxalase-like domain protein n=1 Tax=Actinomadura rubteroloni TaxID=1926885 RepID=A0A2P4UPM4_9ACTN|nr:VOC family protein [Actinomadura rubteroloni]POM27003.1 Glyoxalase-like domain protein [Actinomadura rubteroloni]
MFLGLRTIIYPVRDLPAARRWWSEILGSAPYFDEPFYVGFNVGGYELALDPKGHAESGAAPVTYWGVEDVDHAVTRLTSSGATVHTPVTDHGGGIRTAVVVTPDESLLGVIENPHFPDSPA